MGRSDGRHWGGLVSASGEIRWPSTGRFSWPPSAGHTVDTMISVYTHALERSHEAIRKVIG
jgi:hypothetical protein